MWDALSSDSDFHKIFTDVANRAAVQAADQELGLKEFQECLNKLGEQLCETSSGQLFKDKMDKIKVFVTREVTEKPEDQRDPLTALKFILLTSKALFQIGASETLFKTECYNLAFMGLTLFLKQGATKEMRFHFVVLALEKKYDILNAISSESLYTLYSQCWQFLEAVASYGFKLELLQWKIVKKARETLYNSSTYFSEDPSIRSWVLSTLAALLSTTVEYPLNAYVLAGSSKDTKNGEMEKTVNLTNDAALQLCSYVSHAAAPAARELRIKALENDDGRVDPTCSYMTGFSTLVCKKVWQLSLVTCLPTPDTLKTLLSQEVLLELSQVFVRRLYIDIAGSLSNYLYKDFHDILTSTHFLYKSENVVSMQLHVLSLMTSTENTQIPAKMKEDPDVFILVESVVKRTGWYRTVQEEEKDKNIEAGQQDRFVIVDLASKRSHAQAVHYSSCLISAEYKSIKEAKKNQSERLNTNQVHDMQSLNRLQEQKAEAETYGVVRLELMKRKLIVPVLQTCLMHEAEDPALASYSNLAACLALASSEKKFVEMSLDHYVRRRKMLWQFVSRSTKFAITKLHQGDLHADLVRNVTAAARLFNKFCFAYYTAQPSGTTADQFAALLFQLPQDAKLVDGVAEILNRKDNVMDRLRELFSVTNNSKTNDDEARLRILELQFEMGTLLWNLQEVCCIPASATTRFMTVADLSSVQIFYREQEFSDVFANKRTVQYKLHRLAYILSINTDKHPAMDANVILDDLKGKYRTLVSNVKARIALDEKREAYDGKYKQAVLNETARQKRLARFASD